MKTFTAVKAFMAVLHTVILRASYRLGGMQRSKKLAAGLLAVAGLQTEPLPGGHGLETGHSEDWYIGSF